MLFQYVHDTGGKGYCPDNARFGLCQPILTASAGEPFFLQLAINADGSIVVKAVNCSEEPQPCTISVQGGVFASAAKTVFTGPGARASNDPLRRDALNEVKGVSTVKDGEISETLPPLSLTVYRIAK